METPQEHGVGANPTGYARLPIFQTYGGDWLTFVNAQANGVPMFDQPYVQDTMTNCGQLNIYLGVDGSNTFTENYVSSTGTGTGC